MRRTLVLSLTCVSVLGCTAAEAWLRNLSDGLLVDSLQEGEWTYWHENGELRARGAYRNDRQIGPWTYWYDNGQVEWRGNFAKDRIHGPSTFYYDNGQRRAEGWFYEGLEDGRWSLWTPEGDLEQQGNFLAGQAQLRWTYFHPDGRVLAEGYKLDGEKVGVWQAWDEDGTLFESVHPLPRDVGVVNETWDDGAVRREGFQGRRGQMGRWLTWHRGGNVRASGVFDDGLPAGVWHFFTPDGSLLASGKMEGGRFVGEWEIFEGESQYTRPGERFPVPDRFDGTWSEDEHASGRPVGEVLAKWVTEAMAPVRDFVDQEASAGVEAPPDRIAALTARKPNIPLKAQPWTASEQKSLDYLITRYREGEAAARPPAGSRYGRRQARADKEEESTGDQAKSEPMLGKTLPVTQFRSGLGEWTDLDDYKGRKAVVLVVLRGFAREVCVYCVTQTAALAEVADDFNDLDAEVFVLYPGERNRLDAFMDAYDDVTNFEGELPVHVLYDPDYALVQRLGIASELAIPTTLILDRDGVVRYAYVGTTIEDRPPAKDLLRVVKELNAR